MKPGAWEDLGGRWGLCLPFGPRSDQPGIRSRVELSFVFDGWLLRQDIAGSSFIELGETVAIDETDVEAAKAWALAELASVARDRAMRYSEQTFSLMAARE